MITTGGAPRPTLGALLALAAAAALLGGCVAARDILVEPGKGGVIAVPDRGKSNREKAEALMRENCRGAFDITREEEVPVGSRVRGETTTSRDLGDDIVTRETYSVKTKYEWRIHYLCR